MSQPRELPTVLIVDDNPADRMLAVTALHRARLNNPVVELENGQELMDYLLRQGKYVNEPDRKPLVVMLDINMPVKSGLEALGEIKANPDLHNIPVIILTTSSAEADILRSYDLGVNSFITKPVSFPDFLEVMRQVGQYWLELVSVPSRKDGA
jgi:two-component system, response regulator